MSQAALNKLVAKLWYAYNEAAVTAVDTTADTFSWSSATGYSASLSKPRFVELRSSAAAYYSTGGTAAGTVTPTAGMRYLPTDTPVIVQLPEGTDPTVKIVAASGSVNVSVNFGL
jgi:hypothetical protein